MKKLRLTIILFCAMLIHMCADAQKTLGKCIRVVDGDTYVFVVKNGDTVKVRDAYCNTPEQKNAVCKQAQPYSVEATNMAKRLLLGKEFAIKIVGYDIYGRTLAYTKLGDVYYHRYMINEGYAWSNRQSGVNYRLQKKAKKKGIGLWADKAAVNPSLWLRTYSTHLNR